MTEQTRQDFFYDLYKSLSSKKTKHERLLSSSVSGAQRLRQVLRILKPLLSTPSLGGPIVDVGCGFGHYTEALASLGYVVGGVDFCADFVKSCRESAKEKGLDISYRVGSFETLPEIIDVAPRGFLSVGVLQNVDQPDVAIRSMGAVLEPNGWVCVETLNRLSLKKILFPKIDCRNAFYTRRQLHTLFRANGFHQVKIFPVFILPKWLSWASSALATLAKIPLLNRLLTPLAHGLCVTARLR